MAELFNITVHSPDPERLARFWSEALGFPVAQVGPGLVRLAGSGAPNAPDLLVLAGDPTGGSALHLDLAADDVDAEVGRLCSLGATLVAPRPRPAPPPERPTASPGWCSPTQTATSSASAPSPNATQTSRHPDRRA